MFNVSDISKSYRRARRNVADKISVVWGTRKIVRPQEGGGLLVTELHRGKVVGQADWGPIEADGRRYGFKLDLDTLQPLAFDPSGSTWRPKARSCGLNV